MVNQQLLKLLKARINKDYETCCKEADHLLHFHYETAKRRASDEGRAWASGYRSGKFDENQRVLKILEEVLK